MGCLLERTARRYVPDGNSDVPGVFIHTPILTTSEGSDMISTAATVTAVKKWVECLGQVSCQPPRVLSLRFSVIVWVERSVYLFQSLFRELGVEP